MISEAGSPSPAAIPSEAAAGRAALSRAPRISIYVVVFALVVALVAPAIGFLAFIVHQQIEEREQEVSRRGEQLAGEIADRFEQELQTLTTMLAVFASSGWLEAEEYALLHRRARSALAGTSRHLIVLNEDLEQVLNTRVSFGTSLGKTADPETARKAMELGKPIVSRLFHGNVADTEVFNVLLPVALPDGRKLILILTRDAASLDRLFGTALEVSGWSFAVLDGAGQVVTKALDPAADDDAVPAACLDTIFGFRTWGSPESEQYLYDRGIEGALWSVCVWADAANLATSGGRSWASLLAAAIVWSGGALVAAVLVSAGISRAIAETARIGEALEAGHEVPRSPSSIKEVDDVRRSLASAAADRLRKDERLRLLQRETAHRAKNQIALAVSLVSLSSRSATSVDALRNDLTDRLVALGRSIDVLADEEGQAAPLGELIRAHLKPFLDQDRTRLLAQGDDVRISQGAAQSLSLVLHELATNASKYGAWSRTTGKVAISWKRVGDRLFLEWSEKGVSASAPEREGFGSTLIHMLIENGFGGTIERRFDSAGFSCRISLPLQAVTPAAQPKAQAERV